MKVIITEDTSVVNNKENTKRIYKIDIKSSRPSPKGRQQEVLRRRQDSRRSLLCRWRAWQLEELAELMCEFVVPPRRIRRTICASGSLGFRLFDSRASLRNWLRLNTRNQFASQLLTWRIISTQLLDQSCRIASDVSWKFDGIDSFQNDVVSSHRVRPGERRRSLTREKQI